MGQLIAAAAHLGLILQFGNPAPTHFLLAAQLISIRPRTTLTPLCDSATPLRKSPSPESSCLTSVPVPSTGLHWSVFTAGGGGGEKEKKRMQADG